MKPSTRDFLMRTASAPKQGDWFRIANKKKDDKADVDYAEVFIYDEIGFWGTSAQDFIKQVAAIEEDLIHLHINSPGGEVFDGVAIYNALAAHHADVHVYIDALAASAASFIAQAGDKIFMTRNATMMIHDASAICWGNAAEMTKTADLLNKLSNN